MTAPIPDAIDAVAAAERHLGRRKKRRLRLPDDDPAMGQIWEALIGPEDGGPDSVGLGY